MAILLPPEEFKKKTEKENEILLVVFNLFSNRHDLDHHLCQHIIKSDVSDTDVVALNRGKCGRVP
jgi:hypothetical protein